MLENNKNKEKAFNQKRNEGKIKMMTKKMMKKRKRKRKKKKIKMITNQKLLKLTEKKNLMMTLVSQLFIMREYARKMKF